VNLEVAVCMGETAAIVAALGTASLVLGAPGFTWLRVGFAARAALALFEFVGYAMNAAPGWQLPFNHRAPRQGRYRRAGDKELSF
jgi:hypothetical protein